VLYSMSVKYVEESVLRQQLSSVMLGDVGSQDSHRTVRNKSKLKR